MQPIVNKLLKTLAVAVVMLFIGFELGFAISGQALPALAIFFLVFGAIIWWLLLARNRKSGMEAALYYALDWWKRVNQEETKREDWHGTAGYAGQRKFYAFVRKRLNQYKAGREAVMVVEQGDRGFDMVRAADNPSPEEIKSPFSIVQGYLHITPIPTSELYPKYLDMFPPHLRRGKRGVTVNVGPMGSTGAPTQPDQSAEEEK